MEYLVNLCLFVCAKMPVQAEYIPNKTKRENSLGTSILSWRYPAITNESATSNIPTAILCRGLKQKKPVSWVFKAPCRLVRMEFFPLNFSGYSGELDGTGRKSWIRTSQNVWPRGKGWNYYVNRLYTVILVQELVNEIRHVYLVSIPHTRKNGYRIASANGINSITRIGFKAWKKVDN